MDAYAHGVTTAFLSSFTAEVAATCRIGGKVPMMKMIHPEKRRRHPAKAMQNFPSFTGLCVERLLSHRCEWNVRR